MNKIRAEVANVIPLFEDFNDRNDICDECPFYGEECSGDGDKRCFVDDILELLKRGCNYERSSSQLVSVEDGLPPVGERVIAMINGGVCFEAYTDCEHVWYRTGTGQNIEQCLGKVTHWMYMPKLPKEETK